MPVLSVLNVFLGGHVAGFWLKNMIVGWPAVALVVSNTFPLSAQESIPPDLIEQIKQAVVTITAFDTDRAKLRQGSGFFVGPRQIVSSMHVLEDAYQAEAKMADGSVHPIAGVLAEDKKTDLVLLAVEMPAAKVKSLQVAETLPREGETVVVVGSPLGLEQSLSTGIVAAIRHIPNYGEIIQFTAPIASGSSGSPVVNLNAQVIGVVMSQSSRGQNINFAVPGKRAAALKSETIQKLPDWTFSKTMNLFEAASGPYDYELGWFFLDMKNYETALSHFKTAVDKNPEHVDARFYAGYCHYKLGRYQEAVATYKEVIRIKPSYVEAYCIMGLAYGKSGQHDKEIEAYEEAIRIEPGYDEAYYYLGLAYEYLQRYQEAIEATRQAIQLNPDSARAHYLLGLLYLRIQDHDSARKIYKILMGLDKDLARQLFDEIY
jgi:Tfp pilus assembly protein PilF